MILEVYTVYDKAVQAYLQPFYCRARGEAIRSFSEAVNKEDNQFHKHAADYYLVYLGEWNDAAGVFRTHEPERVVSAVEVLVPDNPFTKEMEVVESQLQRTPRAM